MAKVVVVGGGWAGCAAAISAAKAGADDKKWQLSCLNS